MPQQDPSIQYWIITWILPALGVLGGWLLHKFWPQISERQSKRLDADLETQRDDREHRQRQEELKAAYYLSEAAVAQQVMAELVANSQEGEREANRFVREDIKRMLETINGGLGNIALTLNTLTETESNRAKLMTLQNGILSDVSQDLRGQQAKISMLIELLDGKQNKPG